MIQNKPLRIIGLTGNTGSGKTSVADILKECGGFIINADELAHNIIKAGQRAYTEVLDYFGNDILEPPEMSQKQISHAQIPFRQIDRKRLGAIVFADAEKKKKLEEITHKYVLENIYGLIKEAQANSGLYKFIVIDAPLLIESGLHNISDIVWVVYAPEEHRLKRIMLRDNLTAAQAGQRIASQTNFLALREYADDIIENTGNFDSLEQIVKSLIRLRI